MHDHRPAGPIITPSRITVPSPAETIISANLQPPHRLHHIDHLEPHRLADLEAGDQACEASGLELPTADFQMAAELGSGDDLQLSPDGEE